MKGITIFILGLFLTGIKLNAQNPVQAAAYFEINATELKPEELKRIDSLLNNLDRSLIDSVKLFAYADAPGSSAYNFQLGEKRLKSLHPIFSAFLNDSLISSQNFSDSQEIDSVYNDERRKVDIRIFLKPEPDYGPGIEALLNQLSEPGESFTIDSQKDTSLLTKKGTIIHIPSKAFVGANSKDPITITVREVRKKSEMILEGLTTMTTDGQVLESDGMFKVEATQGKKELKLRAKKDIVVFTEVKKPLDRPQLFDAWHDDSLNNILWDLNANSISQMPLDQMSLCCGTLDDRNGSCPFFFCKIKRFFNPPSSSNRQSRRRGGEMIEGIPCGIIKEYFDKYGVEDLNELRELLENRNPELAGKIETDADLMEAISADQKKEKEVQFAKGNFQSNDVEMYLFNLGSLGWRNVDCFTGSWQIPISVVVPAEPINHCKVNLVFKDMNVIIAGRPLYNVGFTFDNLPKGKDAHVVALKYINEEAYIAIQEIEIGDKIDLEFKKASLAEIKSALATIDP